MKFDSSFMWGVGVGVVGLMAFHRWVKPMPSTKG